PNVAFQRPQSLLLPTYLGDFGPKPPERGAQAHLRAAIPFTFGIPDLDITGLTRISVMKFCRLRISVIK
ncbi:MAG: hypothetical protein WAV70_20625, partial [Anaerolineae bacterium]